MIIDDEQDSVSLLKLQLEKYCPQVHEVATYTNPVLAAGDIAKINPQLVFLDIEMPLLNGFELLEKIAPVTFNVVFITAYNQHAVKAFRFNALDYLVKPVDKDELINAVNKAEKSMLPSGNQIEELKRQLRGGSVTKIAVSSQSGIMFITLGDIILCEASNNYTKIILTDGSTHTVSKTLKDVQDVLEQSHFLRVHRQYIVNLNNVKHFNRNDCILTMINKAEIPVARHQKDKLIEMYRVL